MPCIKQLYVKNAPNLYLLPAPCNMLQLSRYKDQWCRLIAYLRNQYDYILLDCPAGIGPGFDFATSLVDEAILVTTGGIASLHDARKVKDILDYRGICCEYMIMHEETKRHLFESRRMGIAPMEELLEVTLLGKIPYDENIPISQNIGIPYLNLKRKTKEAFIDIAFDHGLASPDTADKTYRKALGKMKKELKKKDIL